MGPSNRAGTTEPPIPLTYLAGISYCGSTLLSLVLNTHPRILSIGELGPRFIENRERYLCSCGESTSDCGFYVAVKHRMAERGVDFDEVNMFLRHNYSDRPWVNRVLTGSLRIPALDRMRDAVRDRLPGVRQRLAEVRQRNDAFIRSALETAGKRMFLDATKEPRRIPFLQELTSDLRVVHLVRDPRGYLYSARKRSTGDAEAAARHWVDGHGAVEQIVGRLPTDRRIRVRYEDICADPQVRLTALTGFMGLEPFSMMPDFNDYPHHIIGNSMRQSKDRRAQIRLDDSWRKVISAEDQRTVWNVAGEMAERFGYRFEPAQVQPEPQPAVAPAD